MAQDIITRVLNNDSDHARHIVAESTNILSTNFGGGHIYSIVIDEDMDNGLIVARDVLVDGQYEDEVWKAKDYVAGDEPLLLLNPPVMPFTDLKGLATEDCFYNAAGDVVRAYTLRVGDRFTLSEAAFASAPAVAKYVTYNATNKNYVVGDTKAESGFCAQVIAKTLRTNMVMYKLQVVSL